MAKVKIYTFAFTDRTTGEDFFVEAGDKYEANDVAHFFFDMPRLYAVYDNDDVEDMMVVECAGYDTYSANDIEF